MAQKRPDAFDIRLNDEQRKRLAYFLTQQVQDAINARSQTESSVDYWWLLYEQARSRSKATMPWPDAADLTSYLASEKVDSLHARIMRSVWTEPVFTVEGWGSAAERAPMVEEFTQWKAEEGRLQNSIDKWVLASLVEPRGLIECYEATEVRTVRKRMTAKIQTDPETGGVLLDETGQVQLQRTPDGQGYVESTDPNDLSAETVVDSTERVRVGPMERVLPYADSLIFPGHARDKSEIWGYGKRLWLRHTELRRKAKAKLYDDDAVSRIPAVEERETTLALQRSGQAVTPTDPSTATIELWELLVLLDLEVILEQEGVPRNTTPGPRWYVATISVSGQSLLRFQHDDLERSRFVPMILFPRPDRATEGYSVVGHKLLTTIEEHTSVRNARADRNMLVVQAPIKRQQGALWDPDEQPWGPHAVIDVRDMRELEPMIVPDVTPALMEWEQSIERTSERIMGVNDISSGQVNQESRTLGEVQMATASSEVRMDLILHRMQESLEELAQIRHAIWKRTLASMPEGVDAPSTMLASLEGQGVSIDQYLPQKKITAALLEGAFRFKPHGSVETADLNRLRTDLVQFMQALLPFLQAFPMAAPMFQTPQAARAMARQLLRVFHVQNTQAILGSPSQDLMQNQMLGMLPPPMLGMPPPMMGPPGLPPGMGGPPGLPPGPPPMGPPNGQAGPPMPPFPMPPGVQ